MNVWEMYPPHTLEGLLAEILRYVITLLVDFKVSTTCTILSPNEKRSKKYMHTKKDSTRYLLH